MIGMIGSYYCRDVAPHYGNLWPASKKHIGNWTLMQYNYVRGLLLSIQKDMFGTACVL